MTDTHVSFPIFKFERTPDGDLIVTGKCTDGSVDHDHQIVDSTWSGKALTDWLSTGGNMRVQHSPFLYPAGKGSALEIDRDGDGGHWLKALVVEDNAKKLVEKGVLRDFSIGIMDPQIVHNDMRAPNGVIVGGTIGEVSLVDRGSNKNTTFTLVKGFGAKAKLMGEFTELDPKDRAKLVTPSIFKKRKPGTQYAGPGDSFPISGKGDVSDAASLAHHADDPAAVRANIKRIARDKFGKDTKLPPTLADKTTVPDVVKDDDEDDSAPCPTCHGKGKIRGGNMDCPDCKGKGLVPQLVKAGASDDDEDTDDEDTDDVAAYNAESPQTQTPDGPSEGDKSDAEGAASRAANKARKRAMKRQRQALKAAAHTESGVKEPGDTGRGDSGGKTPASVMGGKDPQTAIGQEFSLPDEKVMIPAGERRGSKDEDDLTEEMPGSDWSVTKSAPSDGLRLLHDITCPAHSWKTVRKGYGLSRDVGAAIPVSELQDVALKAIENGQFEEARYFADMLGVAATMQQLSPELLLEARKALPEMFPTAHPHQQTDVRPSQFRSGYQSSGRPSLSASGASGGNHLPAAPRHEVSATDFHRPFIQSGRAENAKPEGTQATAGTAAFGSALNSLAVMHEHVSSMWPGVCPANVTQRDYSQREGHTGISPSKKLETAKAPGESKKAEAALRKQLAAATALNKALEQDNAMLGALPDPEQAPFRGTPQLDGPVDRESFVGKTLGAGSAGSEVEDEDAGLLEYVNGLAASGDPRMRLNASKALAVLVTK